MNDSKLLKSLPELKNSGFGQPSPRHGLKLLHWFATECYNEKCWKYNLEDFGFERFWNRKDKNGHKLLPDGKFFFYEVGNLKKWKKANKSSYMHHSYVLEDFTGECDESNMDRIIVSINKKKFNKIYVTEHNYKNNGFNKEATYCISKDLIMIIKDLTMDEFIQQTERQKNTEQNSDIDEVSDSEDMPFIPTSAKTQPYSKYQQQTPKRKESCMCCQCVIL